MKKIALLGLVLLFIIAMTVPAMGASATAFDESITGSNWVNGGITGDLNAGWSVDSGTGVYRKGTASGNSFWVFPAVAAAGGSSYNKSTGDGNAFSLHFSLPNGTGGVAGSSAWSKAKSSGLELALAGILNPHTYTQVDVSGYASQRNGAFSLSQIGSFSPNGIQSWADGGNSNEAGYRAGMHLTGSLLSGSAAGGEAEVRGFTFVRTTAQGVPGSWADATTFGITGNSGRAIAGPNGVTGVAGIGGMETGILIVGQNPNNFATTHTISTFGYNNSDGAMATGSGIASGFGHANITRIPNGVVVTSQSGSFARAN